MNGECPQRRLRMKSEAAPQRRNAQSFDDVECGEQCDCSNGSGDHGGVECPAPDLIERKRCVIEFLPPVGG